MISFSALNETSTAIEMFNLSVRAMGACVVSAYLGRKVYVWLIAAIDHINPPERLSNTIKGVIEVTKELFAQTISIFSTMSGVFTIFLPAVRLFGEESLVPAFSMILGIIFGGIIGFNLQMYIATGRRIF